MIDNVIFDLSEVLLPGMIGVEHRLAHRTGLPKEKITQALGSHPHYEAGNILDHLLSGKIWSFEIGATKRDQKPFEVIMSRNNLKPETCLFVDDLARNIGTAQRLGMKTVHFIGRESIKEIYSAIDIKTHAGPVNADSPRGSLKKPCVNKLHPPFPESRG